MKQNIIKIILIKRNCVSEAVTLTLVLYLVSKASISASFLIIYPFAGELYPTEVRGLGIGLSAYIAGLGLIIIPFVNYLVSSIREKIHISFHTLIYVFLLHEFINEDCLFLRYLLALKKKI